MNRPATWIPQMGDNALHTEIEWSEKTPAYALGSTYRGVSRKTEFPLMPMLPDGLAHAIGGVAE